MMFAVSQSEHGMAGKWCLPVPSISLLSQYLGTLPCTVHNFPLMLLSLLSYAYLPCTTINKVPFCSEPKNFTSWFYDVMVTCAFSLTMYEGNMRLSVTHCHLDHI